MNDTDREDSVTLEILQTIDEKDNVTQRLLSEQLGVALGLTNSYLKRCAKKGFIKIKQAPANRYLYYLTPKGFAEKSRLTTRYLTASFDYYRKSSESLRDVFREMEKRDKHKIIFCGVSEIAEIASIRITEFNMKHASTFDQSSSLKKYLNKPVLNSLNGAMDADAFLVTALNNPRGIYRRLLKYRKEGEIFVPSVLDI